MQCCLKNIKTTLNRILSYVTLSRPFQVTLRDFWLVQCCPKSIKKTLQRSFFMECCLEPLGEHYIKISPVHCCPKSLRRHWKWLFPVNCCLEPQEQHYIGCLLMQSYLEPLGQRCVGFLSEQYYPKSIS